ncbi:MarR family winged helix-turn-helix transcriptional regulator [Streptomyces abikoensis]|uniref:MarR family winged helix-turn-helix transcriptional regulator n=1 Tax=Streptomyces abikoensis TaxID=97398 RepID=UPI00372316B6
MLPYIGSHSQGGAVPVSINDDSTLARAQGWRTLAALHARIEDALERALQRAHGLSVSEYGVLDTLSQEGGYCLRMNQLSRAVVLSQSATTRLVSRLERRGLLERYICDDDRRGIYTQVTAEGRTVLEQARPTYDDSLAKALREAQELPELSPLVDTLTGLPLQTSR